MSWFAKTFNKDYLTIYAHRDEAEAQRHLEFVTQTIPVQTDWRILDLACGDGRHTHTLFGMNYPHIMGLDLSGDLLAAARHRSKSNQQTIPFVNADMRFIPFLPRSFDLILSLFTSFGYFSSDAENADMIKSISALLKPEGNFYLDYLNPTKVRRELAPRTERTIDDKLIVEKRWITADGKRVEKDIFVRWDGGETTYHESVRLFDFDQLVDMLTKAGLKLTDSFGDYEHGPIRSDSPRLILIAQKL